MKYSKPLSRRTLLKAGSITLGLPFLESMRPSTSFAASPDASASMLSLMFGLGTPYQVLDRGLEGPLRYYKPFIDQGKVSLYTDVDMSAAAEQPEIGQHHHGQPYLFSGYRTKLLAGNNVEPQGPTLHVEVMAANYAAGPPTDFRIIDTGIYFRRGINYQYQRVFDKQGKNAADFEDLASPHDFFDKIFGQFPAAGEMSPKERASRSIIDYLVPAYSKYTQAGSALPASDVAIFKNHLDRVRQVERNVYSAAAMTRLKPDKPNAPALDYKVDGGNDSDPANVHRVAPADFAEAYQILADLFVIGLETDAFRFGNLSFDSGGGHTHFVGPYANPDDADYHFDGNPHHDYHRLDAADPEAIKVGTAHNYFIHENITKVLAKLDSGSFPAENGKTILENSCVLIGSEVGTNHDLTRVFHGFAGGAGRLKLGSHVTDRVRAIELYNAIGHSYSVPNVGDGRDYASDEASIIA